MVTARPLLPLQVCRMSAPAAGTGHNPLWAGSMFPDAKPQFPCGRAGPASRIATRHPPFATRGEPSVGRLREHELREMRVLAGEGA
jgi:hypothetical protein